MLKTIPRIIYALFTISSQDGFGTVIGGMGYTFRKHVLGVGFIFAKDSANAQVTRKQTFYNCLMVKKLVNISGLGLKILQNILKGCKRNSCSAQSHKP